MPHIMVRAPHTPIATSANAAQFYSVEPHGPLSWYRDPCSEFGLSLLAIPFLGQFSQKLSFGVRLCFGAFGRAGVSVGARVRATVHAPNARMCACACACTCARARWSMAHLALATDKGRTSYVE